MVPDDDESEPLPAPPDASEAPEPTLTGLKRIDPDIERTITRDAGNSGEWKTRITKVQVIKPTTETGEACLVLLYPPGPDMGKRFPLARDELVLGRGVDCHVRVDRDSVSRRHARVRRSDNAWLVQDLGSTNGTYLNDVVVAESKLRDGDFVKIGAAIFKFLSGSGIEASYHEEIYRMTISDALTGAFNKRYFLEFLEREIARCERFSRPLSITMFDLDHFKQINETHGHLTGDYVLREIGFRVLSKTRREEVFARYGGEEFVVALPETDLDGALKAGEQLRRIVADTPFHYEGDTFTVTVSVGVAALEHEMDPHAFVKVADENLYRAKREGRNRVVAKSTGSRGRWNADPKLRSRVSGRTAITALSLLARDQVLASEGGAARVDDVEGLLQARLREQGKSDISFGALENTSKLLVALEGRNAVHRLRVILFEALRTVADQRPDVQFAIGPVRLATDAKVIEEIIASVDDEIGHLENGRYLPQPLAIATRAIDGVTNARAKLVLELAETLLQWLSLAAAADLASVGEAPRTTTTLQRTLTGGVTMGRWHEIFVTAVKELLATTATHDSAWRACFGDSGKRSELFAWLGSLVELRNAFAHGATASDEHLARQLVDSVAPRLRTTIRRDLRPVLALVAADVELLGFEGELQSYRLTRLVGHGIAATVTTYSRRRMNPGLWLCDAIADRAVPLEPFFVRDTCPKCGARELFLLSRLDRLEHRNPATGHVLAKGIDELPLSEDAHERLVELTSKRASA